MQQPNTVFMFSGQGSHYYQMGQALYEQKPVFRACMDRLDLVARDLSGVSIVDTLYRQGRTKADVFDRLLLTHPAIFMVEYALAQTLIEDGIIPDMTLGASLGSFAAAAVSGCVSEEDALTAVITQARLFEMHCQKGGMMAILADPLSLKEELARHHGEIASYNFASHFVVSADQDGLAGIGAFLDQQCIPYQRLPISFAFHSRWIDAAKAPIENFMKLLPQQPARIPMACCLHADVLHALPENHFWNVARGPIQFLQTIAKLEMQGSYRYIDVGPAGTLATFIKYLLPRASTSTFASTLTPLGRDLENLALLKVPVPCTA